MKVSSPITSYSISYSKSPYETQNLSRKAFRKFFLLFNCTHYSQVVFSQITRDLPVVFFFTDIRFHHKMKNDAIAVLVDCIRLLKFTHFTQQKAQNGIFLFFSLQIGDSVNECCKCTVGGCLCYTKPSAQTWFMVLWKCQYRWYTLDVLVNLRD